MNRERVPLIFKNVRSDLSLFFATLCVIDIFGVFPIIALPRSIVQCGLYGIPLVLVVFALQVYTSILLGKSWIMATTIDPRLSRKDRNPLAAVTELIMGSRAKIFVTVILDLAVFGCAIPNLLVASQNLQLFGMKISGQRFDLSFCHWLLIVGVILCPIMWLGSPRDMKFLASFSCAMVIFTTLLIWWCIITDNRTLEDVVQIPTSPTWDKFLSGYGMLAFQFDVHPTLMTVQVDMKRPQDINKAVVISFLVSGSLFVVTAGLAVWKYGGSTTANVLQILPASFPLNAAILFSALQLCLSSALGHSALFQDLEGHCDVDRNFGWKRCAIRSAIVFLGVAVAESVPRFDIVMALIGGSLTGPLVFVLPPLIYSKVVALKAKTVNTSEFYLRSGRRESSGNISSDSRIHSRSIYYGILGAPKTEIHRYSYVYYDEIEDDFDDNTVAPEELIMTRRTHDGEPIFLDACESSRCYEKRVITQNPTKRLSSQKWNDWFGYFIVVFGIIITISSTYINIKNTIRYVRFTPSCIANITTV